MHCFLKVLATFYKEISETIEALELWESENLGYLLKKLKSFNATRLIMNWSECFLWNKNKIGTFWGWNPLENKNMEPHQNFTGSYNKEFTYSFAVICLQF